MLKKRIIPILLWKDTGLIKGKNFNSWRRVGSVLPVVRVYNMRDVDELILLNIESTLNNKPLDLELIKEVSKSCSVPLTVGGGINSIKFASKILSEGADKISINTAAYNNLNLIKELSNEFGRQCIVASIDVKKNYTGDYSCHSHSGTIDTKICPYDWAKKLEDNGAGEILITSIDNEGMMNGYDIDLVKKIMDQVKIPVIASGGAGEYSHATQLIKKTDVSAVAVSSMFHFTELTPSGLRKDLELNNIMVRKKVSIF